MNSSFINTIRRIKTRRNKKVGQPDYYNIANVGHWQDSQEENFEELRELNIIIFCKKSTGIRIFEFSV